MGGADVFVYRGCGELFINERRVKTTSGDEIAFPNALAPRGPRPRGRWLIGTIPASQPRLTEPPPWLVQRTSAPRHPPASNSSITDRLPSSASASLLTLISNERARSRARSKSELQLASSTTMRAQPTGAESDCARRPFAESRNVRGVAVGGSHERVADSATGRPEPAVGEETVPPVGVVDAYAGPVGDGRGAPPPAPRVALIAAFVLGGFDQFAACPHTSRSTASA